MDSNTTKELKPFPPNAHIERLREGLNQAIELLVTALEEPEQITDEEIHDLRTLELSVPLTNTELNQDIVGQLAEVIVERDRLEARNRLLEEALGMFEELHINMMPFPVFDDARRNMSKVLAQSPVELYKAQMAVIEAAIEWNTIDGDNDSEAMVVKLEKAVTALLEHNRGDES